MRTIAVIGAGISGLSVAQMLRKRYDVTVFERNPYHGGLVHCKQLREGLFHTCGGHVFNTKNEAISKWFWSFFDHDTEFMKTKRNSTIYFDNHGFIPYPIENHVYRLGDTVLKAFLDEIKTPSPQAQPTNFKDFLLNRFGKTLFDLYFGPYNEKIWRQDLSTVPLQWLEGKLPTPSAEEMVKANQEHIEERSFVHSTFWYPKCGGSQFVADRLSKDLHIEYNKCVDRIVRCDDGRWMIADRLFDGIVFCGNLKQLPVMVDDKVLPPSLTKRIEGLSSHGTTSVFCRMDDNPYSWVYQPSQSHSSHRIICTGNFSSTNNYQNAATGVIEFTDEIDKDEIMRQLRLMPFSPQYIEHNFSPFSYPIQDASTRQLVQSVKDALAPYNIRLVGRFAEWEYYNMDAAMSSASQLDWIKEDLYK